MTPVFLTADDVMAIHDDQIEGYGGSHGIRDTGLLESAVAMPQAAFADQYLHNGLCEMAAAYLFHIVQNHPFIDGNKRVGAASALVFLEINDVMLKITNKVLVELFSMWPRERPPRRLSPIFSGKTWRKTQKISDHFFDDPVCFNVILTSKSDQAVRYYLIST